MPLTIFGLRISKKRNKPLTGAAATAVQRKAAGLNGRPPGSGRKKGQYALSTLERAEQRYKAEIARLNIEEKRLTIEDKRATLEMKREKRSQDPLAEVERALKLGQRLKELGREANDDSGGMQSVAMQALRALGAGVGQTLGSMVQAQIAAQDAAQHTNGTAQPVPQLSSGQPVTPQQETIEMNVARIKRDLTGKTPQYAAQWLVSQRGMIETQVRNALIQTEDGNIPLLIPQVRNFSGDMADWMQERLPWIIEVAHELRAMHAAQASGSRHVASNVSPL